jgi:uncharacterized protein (DUF58 family)
VSIDPGFLDELERYARARERNVADRFQGEQRTRERGEGLTFADYRRYAPGDDTRRIDWRLFARTDEFYVTEYEAERNRTLHVLLDASGSMGYAGDGVGKFEFAAKLGLGFAYLIAREHDDFRFSLFDERPRRIDRGRSNRGEVLSLVDQLGEVTPEGEGDLAAALEAYADEIASRSLVLVLSDCLAPADEIERALEALARNELVLARVLDPVERDLPVSGDVEAEDPETTRSLRTHVGSRRRESYRSRLEDHIDDVAERARLLRARHRLVETDRDFFEAFGDVWTA